MRTAWLGCETQGGLRLPSYAVVSTDAEAFSPGEEDPHPSATTKVEAGAVLGRSPSQGRGGRKPSATARAASCGIAQKQVRAWDEGGGYLMRSARRCGLPAPLDETKKKSEAAQTSRGTRGEGRAGGGYLLEGIRP